MGPDQKAPAVLRWLLIVSGLAEYAIARADTSVPICVRNAIETTNEHNRDEGDLATQESGLMYQTHQVCAPNWWGKFMTPHSEYFSSTIIVCEKYLNTSRILGGVSV